jgi:predicted PurR-regulated permease PerM
VRPEHLYKFAGLLLLAALVYTYFESIARVLLIAYAAAILAVALNAIARRLPLERRWSAAILGVVILVAFGAALWFGGAALLSQLRDLAESLPRLEEQSREWGDWLRSRLGLDVQLIGDRTVEMVKDYLGGLGGSDVIGQARGLLEWLALPLLVFFGGIFALADPNDRLLTPLLRAIPENRRTSFRRVFQLLAARLTGWVKGQLISMTTIGVLATIAFYLIGVPYPLVFGVLNGLAEFVPIIGPWAGGIPAVVVAFLQDPMKGLWAAVAIIAIQQVESQVLTPLVMAKAAEVHPFITLFAIVLFGGIFGFLGVLLAIPLVLLIWTVVQVLWVERAIGAGHDRIEPVVHE